LSFSRVQGALIQRGLDRPSVFGASWALFFTLLVSIALTHPLNLRCHEARQVVYGIIDFRLGNARGCGCDKELIRKLLRACIVALRRTSFAMSVFGCPLL
jgi:hypothetical protein